MTPTQARSMQLAAAAVTAHLRGDRAGAQQLLLDPELRNGLAGLRRLAAETAAGTTPRGRRLGPTQWLTHLPAAEDPMQAVVIAVDALAADTGVSAEQWAAKWAVGAARET